MDFCPFAYFEIGLFWTMSEHVVTSFLVAADDALSWSFFTGTSLAASGAYLEAKNQPHSRRELCFVVGAGAC